MLGEYADTPITLADLAVAAAFITEEIVAAVLPEAQVEDALVEITGRLFSISQNASDPRIRLVLRALAAGLGQES
jgi:hypothetical protein